MHGTINLKYYYSPAFTVAFEISILVHYKNTNKIQYSNFPNCITKFEE